jgi:hypothetical protein
LLFFARITVAESTPAYPVCDADLSLLVAEVPNNPFYANVTVGAWQNQPDGSKKPIDAPSRDHGYFVARDSSGRVVVKLRGKSTFKGQGRDGTSVAGKWANWSQYVCDPNAGTVTRISYQDVYYGGVDPSTGKDVYLPAGQAGHEFIQPQRETHTNLTFRAYHRDVLGRLNLGPVVHEGIPAFRYRFVKTTDNDPIIHDLVISEDLEACMSQTVGDQDDATLEHEVKLTRIHRDEPDPSSFAVPSGVMIEAHDTTTTTAKHSQALPSAKAP